MTETTQNCVRTRLYLPVAVESRTDGRTSEDEHAHVRRQMCEAAGGCTRLTPDEGGQGDWMNPDGDRVTEPVHVYECTHDATDVPAGTVARYLTSAMWLRTTETVVRAEVTTGTGVHVVECSGD